MLWWMFGGLGFRRSKAALLNGIIAVLCVLADWWVFVVKFSVISSRFDYVKPSLCTISRGSHTALTLLKLCI